MEYMMEYIIVTSEEKKKIIVIEIYFKITYKIIKKIKNKTTPIKQIALIEYINNSKFPLGGGVS